MKRGKKNWRKKNQNPRFKIKSQPLSVSYFCGQQKTIVIHRKKRLTLLFDFCFGYHSVIKLATGDTCTQTTHLFRKFCVHITLLFKV